MKLAKKNWSTPVWSRLNQLLDKHRNQPAYAVFDFDNTSVIHDVQEATMIYQIEQLRFNIHPDQFQQILETNLPDPHHDLHGAGQTTTVRKLTNDLTRDYRYLWEHYEGLAGRESLAEIHQSDYYLDFRAKLRFMYTAVYTSFRDPVVDPWCNYLFVGMTPAEVRQLALESHRHSLHLPLEHRTWTSPQSLPGQAGVIQIRFRSGYRIPEELVDLYQALSQHGIEPYIVSASFRDIIVAIASADEFGYQVPPSHIYGMVLALDDGGRYTTDYSPDHLPTQRQGKTQTIQQCIQPQYQGQDPVLVAGDSQGDYEMLTDFPHLEVGLLFNLGRDDHFAELVYEALAPSGRYQADFLLQGRDEYQGQLRPEPSSLRLGRDEPILTVVPDPR